MERRFFFRNHALVALLSLTLAGCLEGTAKFDEVAEGTDTYNNISFPGIDTINSVTDSTATIHWTHVSSAVAYQIFNTTSGTPVFVGFVLAPTDSYNLTGLTPNATYKFRVNAQSSSGLLDANTTNFGFSTNAAPTPPSGLALFSPSTTPAFDDTPTIRVSGVKSGDVVKLFTDSTCTTQVGSGTASDTTIDITSSSLVAASYTFYANSTNAQASACSTASVAYMLTSCPIGYVSVPGDATLGTTNFCVMQYEAKAWNDANSNQVIDAGEVDADGCSEAGCTTGNWAAIPTYKPVSQAADLPWRRIDQNQARLACDALNSGGTNFDLISNPEWMTIARNIEVQNGNWSGGVVGSGLIFQGNNGVAAASSYNGSDPEGGTGRDTKAMHVLSNGEQIWDISGNVWEWVDWNVTPANKAYVSTDGSPQSAWREFTLLDTLIGLGDEMFPNSWRPTNAAYNSAKGTGQYYAGTNASGGAARRGGGWSNVTNAGVFALNLLNSSAYTSYNSLGFRCVYRP
ncbi:MAG: fibronectin type III domain-containing protein [Nitrosomonas ureae]